MKEAQRFFAAMAMAFVTGSLNAQILIQNTFDSDSQGWTTIGFNAAGTAFSAPPLTWVAGAGNPGGAVRYDSPFNPPYTAFFNAPTDVLAALPFAVGGTMSWDVSTYHNSAAAFLGGTRSDISIGGGGHVIRLFLAGPVGPDSYPGYSHYGIDFTTASGWLYDGVVTAATQAQIDGVLLNAQRLLIRADYWDRTLPTGSYLDNVVVAGIPEPETYSMLLAGLGLLGCAARRRKQKEVALA